MSATEGFDGYSPLIVRSAASDAATADTLPTENPVSIASRPSVRGEPDRSNRHHVHKTPAKSKSNRVAPLFECSKSVPVPMSLNVWGYLTKARRAFVGEVFCGSMDLRLAARPKGETESGIQAVAKQGVVELDEVAAVQQ